MLKHMIDNTRISTLCVFCGSSDGKDPFYREAAVQLSQVMTQKGLSLVYGGGGRGLMGLMAANLYGKVPRVTGVIPEKLYAMVKEITHQEDELVVVKNMHERKAMMYQLSDAFIALPGGVGTLEELMEAFTWLHLGYQRKPVGILNTNGYYDHLLAFLAHTVEEGFLKQEFLNSLVVEEDPRILLERLESIPLELPGKLV
jgi:uncharacterized protein (TIGR00730 family)